MGVSTWSYRGKHFDASDAVLEVWLRLVVAALDEVTPQTSWLAELRQQWYELATEQFEFGVVPDLDAELIDEERRELVLHAAERALSRLEGLGDPISTAQLNALGKGFTRDLPASMFLQVARSFIALLASE
jgi:hypothetical protein